MTRTRRGTTLVELLVSLLMTIVIAGALFAIFTNTYQSRDFVVGQGSAETDARTPLDNLADHLRDAQQYHTVEPPTTASQSSVIAAATANSVTYYESNSSTDTVKLWLNGTDLDRTVGGTTTTVIGNVKSLKLTYYVAPSSGGVVNYNNSALSKTVNENAPTAAEMPFISEITIDAAVNDSGYQRELVCTVRLRNSPYKLKL